MGNGGQTWIVIKLGGTSVSSRRNWDNALAEVRAHVAAGKRVLLVQSALSGITNALEALLAAPDEAAARRSLDDITSRHRAFAAELGLKAVLDPVLEPYIDRLGRLAAGAQLTGEVTPRLKAEVMAAGELMASAVAVLYISQTGLPVSWIDARDHLGSTPQANQSLTGRYLSAVCAHEPDAALQARLGALEPMVLTQGFIARDGRGETVLLGRGGSLLNGTGGSGRERGGRLRSLPSHHLKGLHRYEAGSFYLFLGKTDIRKSSIPASSCGARGAIDPGVKTVLRTFNRALRRSNAANRHGPAVRPRTGAPGQAASRPGSSGSASR